MYTAHLRLWQGCAIQIDISHYITYCMCRADLTESSFDCIRVYFCRYCSSKGVFFNLMGRGHAHFIGCLTLSLY